MKCISGDVMAYAIAVSSSLTMEPLNEIAVCENTRNEIDL